MSHHHLLIVDDEPGIRAAVRKYFADRGYSITEAATVAASKESLLREKPDGIILDHSLPDGTAIDVLQWMRSGGYTIPAVVLTAHGSIELAVESIKEGAENFLTKPVQMGSLMLVVERMLENRRGRQHLMASKARSQRSSTNPFIGNSAAIANLATEAARVATAGVPVLIVGETGSGKGVLASWLHRNSSRSEEAFVDLNCAGLSREFLETELFGHEQGAFTGAIKAKTGLLDIADRGTLFLDEIGDMDAGVQSKLLKVLEDGRFRRMGDTRDRMVDIRLIAATHHNLQQLIQQGKFRSDLYFRINTVRLEVPRLAERREDIPLLAKYLLERVASEIGKNELSLSSQAVSALEQYSWPGNIRELRNVLERAAILAPDQEIQLEHLRFETGLGTKPASRPETFQELERKLLDDVIAECGSVEQAAKKLGMPRSTLYYKLKKNRSNPSKRQA